jgi:hypothetical protein
MASINGKHYTRAPLSRTQIQYILICDETDSFNWLYPENLSKSFFSLLRLMPKDIFQLYDPDNFFYSSIYQRQIIPHNLTVLYSANVTKDILNNFPSQTLKVIIFDSIKVDLLNVIDSVFNLYYLSSPDESFLSKSDDNINKFTKICFNFLKPKEFKSLLCRDRDKILMNFENILDSNVLNLLKKLLSGQDVSDKIIFDLPNFVPIHSSHLILNQITGQIWHSDIKEVPVEISKRWEYLIKSIGVIDYIHTLVKINSPDKFKNITLAPPLLPPLIITAPFHNPHFLKELRSKLENESDEDLRTMIKAGLRVMALEQNINFLYSTEDTDVDSFSQFKHFELKHIRYLDAISFLHATFTLSPVIRLPIVGRQIYQQLSAFSPKTGQKPKKNKVYNLIRALGSKLSTLLIHEDFKKCIIEKNRQVVALTDLPIEWLDVNGVPLGFSHDVCRMPTSNTHGLMANYVRHVNLSYKIPNDILEKTLVLLCSPTDKRIEKSFLASKEFVSNESPVHFEKVNNLESARKVVNELNPQLLILDTHGGYDPVTKSSFIYINDKRIMGKDIIENNITAPLVILSACWTAPLYGYVNTLSEAFLESGTLAVLSAYLPINIFTATVLYTRMLLNLRSAAIHPLHPNWLSFLAHNLRTALITQALFSNKTPPTSLEEDDIYNVKEASEWINKSMDFDERPALFKKWEERLSDQCNDRSSMSGVSFKSKEVVHEYLYYTITGRADLIPFESYENWITNNKNTQNTI